MPKRHDTGRWQPLSPEVVERIVDLRQAGLTIQRIMDTLGVSRGSVHKYSAAPAKLKAPALPRRKGKRLGRKEYLFPDDPRFSDNLDADPYADVVPIPFFPDDLPRLTKDPFWTPARLQWALSQRT